jgi:cell division protein FtsZ
MNVKIIGIGGAGCNFLNHLVETKKSQAELVAVNTDSQSLKRSKAKKKIQLGLGLGRSKGTGGNPITGNQAALESRKKLRALFENTEAVCLVAGLGGGTGTGATPVLAQIARESGVKVISLVTLPFLHEGPIRHQQAQMGLGAIQDQSDVVLKFPNEKIGVVSDQKGFDFSESYDWQDENISQVITAVGDLFPDSENMHEILNLDFEEWKNHVGSSPYKWLGIGTAWGINKITQVVAEALRGTLVEEIQFAEAAKIFLVIVSNEMTLGEFNTLNGKVMGNASYGCKIKIGLKKDPALKKDEIRLSIWAAKD